MHYMPRLAKRNRNEVNQCRRAALHHSLQSTMHVRRDSRPNTRLAVSPLVQAASINQTCKLCSLADFLSLKPQTRWVVSIWRGGPLSIEETAPVKRKLCHPPPPYNELPSQPYQFKVFYMLCMTWSSASQVIGNTNLLRDGPKTRAAAQWHWWMSTNAMLLLMLTALIIVYFLRMD